MAIGDAYEFIARGEVLGQEMVNVFTYTAFTSGDADLEALCTAFEEDVLNVVVGIMGGSTVYTQVEVKQVVGGFAYFVHVFTSGLYGTRTGEQLPTANCWTFRYQRAQLGRRHGYKRFAGIVEGDQSAGQPTSGMLTTLAGVATALEADLVPVSGISLRPCILHGMVNGQPVIPPEPQAIAGVRWSHIGTQNSRKPGRGS